MVSDYKFKSSLPIPREVLWRAITSDNRAFMNHLVEDGALNRMDATKIEDNSSVEGKKGRKQTYVPKTIEIPAMVKSVFNDTYLEIFDTQSWNANKPYELDFEISTGVLGDYYTMHGRTTLEVDPDDKEGSSCIQNIHGTCKVDIPFVGWYVEQAILLNMGQFYDAYPAHIANFVKKLTEKYGGAKDGLLEALKRLETHTDTFPPPPTTNTKEPGTTDGSEKEQQDKAALAAALGQVSVSVSGNKGGIISSTGATSSSKASPSSGTNGNINNISNSNSETIAAATTGEIVNGLHTNNAN